MRDCTKNVVGVPAIMMLAVLALLDGALPRGRYSARLHRQLGKAFRFCVASLGGAYLKAGQLLATRPDICSPEFVAELALLCDRAYQMSAAKGLQDVEPALRARLLSQYEFAPGLSTFSGSVAQIYCATHRTSGRPVAVKIVRQSSRRTSLHDVRMMRQMVMRLSRWFKLSRFGFDDAFSEVARSVVLQFDLKREADAQQKLLQAMDGAAIIARVHEAPSKSVLVMDWLDGMVSPAAVKDEALRKQFATDALRLLYAMIFDHGLVHCDLHPGNLMLRPDGKIVLLDFGLTVRLDPAVRGALARLFLAMATGDASAGVDAVIAVTPSVPPSFNRDDLEEDLAALFAVISRAPVGQFDLIGMARDLIAAQARQGIRQPPEFIMPILALGMLDGRLRSFHPDLDFQREALPYVLRAIACGLDEQEEHGNGQ